MIVRKTWLAACATALLSACATATPPPLPPQAVAAPPPPPEPAKPKPQYGSFGFDAAGMDAAVQPGDDFFEYANGTWVKTTAIPADRSSYNTFAVLREIATQRTQTLIQAQAGADAPAGSEARKIGDYYASFMDEAAVEQAGVAPLAPELARIAGLKTRRDLSAYLGSTLRADVDVLNATNLYTERLFGLWVAEDLNDTSRYAPYLLQGGLGMPDREYYLSDKPKFVET
ncbi:MAG: M13 family metallopeptidase N-terminal domain-containing protein, partial [Phenylobacterium sp.]